MVIILVLLTVATFFVIEALVFPTPTAEVPATLAATRGQHPRAPRARWLHPGHAWVVTRGTREARIGVTDLPVRLLGRVERIDRPQPGARIRQGEPYAALHHGRRTLPVTAPMSGVVLETNRALDRDPGLVSDSPFEHGWIARIEPAEAEHEVHNLLHGVAAERWQDTQQMELARWFAPLAGPAMADGGLAVPDLSDRLDDDDWRRLVDAFYPVSLAVNAGSPDLRKE